MKMYTYTAQNLTADANIAKDVLASALFNAGVIDERQCKTIKEEFAMIVAERNFFGKSMGKLLGWTDDTALYFRAVQFNNIDYNKKEENEDVHQPTEGDQ